MVAFIQVACKAGEAVVVPVQVTVQGSLEELKLEAFIYKPTGDGNFPVVIFNHGSSGGDPKRSFPSRVQAKHFAERGFVVIVPMRRGRGKSEGLSLESEEKNCDTQSWLPGLNAALEDVTAVIDYARRLPYADSSRIVLAGASRGGFLSVAYAAKGLKNAGIVGVINFSGGWVAQAQDNCPIDFNRVSFIELGKQTKTPMLWLYGEDDPFNSLSSIHIYAREFGESGGNVRLELIRGVPGNGHWLSDHPNLWSGIVDEYLASLNLHRSQ